MESIENLKKSLQELECPFTWNIPECIDRQNILERLSSNCEDIQSNFLFNGFCNYIQECFERANNDETELAIRKSQECETQLEEYFPTGLFSTFYQQLWEKSSRVLWHVLLSLQAHLYFKNNNIKIAEEKLQNVIPLESSTGALCAIKSRFYLLYINEQCQKLAIEEARQAVKLDNSVTMWHFLLGKSLAQYRRKYILFGLPSDEEVDALEIAWSECKAPFIGVMLLHSYYKLHVNYGTNNESLKKKILDLVKGIKNNAGNEWYIYWRCAHVCVRLRGLVDKKEVKSLIDSAFEWSDKTHNQNKKHLWEILANYYRFFEYNYEKAIENFIKAADEGEFTCILSILSLSKQLNKKDNLLPLFDKYLKLYSQPDYVMELRILKANYLMFKEKNINDAINMYLDLMEEDCKYIIFRECRPWFGENKNNYSVYDKLKSELVKIMEKNSAEKDKTAFRMYQNYLDRICDYEKKSLE